MYYCVKRSCINEAFLAEWYLFAQPIYCICITLLLNARMKSMARARPLAFGCLVALDCCDVSAAVTEDRRPQSGHLLTSQGPHRVAFHRWKSW